jgi:hypothetical protein
MQTKVGELPISEYAKERLIILCGLRYDEALDLIKLPETRFETAEENTAYVVDLLKELIKAAEAGGDSVEVSEPIVKNIVK